MTILCSVCLTKNLIVVNGSWHEKTHEEFEIIGFNTQEETLILSYMNQEIRLSLLERSKTNLVKQSPPNLPSVNLPPAQANTSGSSARMMPPRPSLPPPMPAWLLERQKIRSTNPYSSSQQVSRTGSRFRGNQPLPFTPQQTSPKQPSASTNVSADPSFLSSSSSPSPQGVRPSFNPSSSPINVTSLPTAERNSFSVDPIINQNKQSDEDLFDDLPPPPPPPNILPPSPPPDIILKGDENTPHLIAYFDILLSGFFR